MGTQILPENLPTPELSAQYCYEISQWVFDNYDRDDVIFATVHGSYLYGTAHIRSLISIFMLL